MVQTGKLNLTPYSLFMVLIIISVTWFLLWLVRKIFLRKGLSEKWDKGVGYTVYSIIKYLAWIIAISLVLESVGIKLTLLLAGSAALLVGVGLGLQQFFKDILSGFIILFERSISVSDVVELDEIIGQVKEIGIRTSKIVTRDNITMTIPNSRFIEDNVINWTTTDVKTRFHVNVGVAYGSDVQKVEQVLIQCAENHKDISSYPKAFVRFNDFGNSSLDFQLYFWTTRSFRVENLKSDLRFAIDAEFRKENIIIPFPQTDVHIKSQHAGS